MKVRGERDNIEKFYNAMMQQGNVYMGRGADASIDYDDEDGTAQIEGWCKWSVASAMVSNAVSMRTEPNTWYWGDGVDSSSLEFVTLFEACKKWNIDMEVYSEEPGCCFQEHYLVIDGDIVCDDCTEWNEYCIEDFETKEEAESELGIEITDEEWNSGDIFISRGGFEYWDFEI
jgi:hypothetical protein